MQPNIHRHSSAIHALCQRYGVKRLELFGSVARGESDPLASDIDFVVEFEQQGWKGSFKRYMGLKLSLEDLFERSVDLVEIDATTNAIFVAQIAQDRRPIYAA